MSINTSNLVTTENGQALLADVHSINERLRADGRHINVVLFFPYIAISQKTDVEVAAITDTTYEQIKQEPCWAPVDVCQVQQYAVLTEIKRDFTIGGLFDVEQDISNARTVILFSESKIIDNRSEEEKEADGHNSAAHILDVFYGFETSIVPYAYTQILNSNGELDPNGISIGASRYGRARHRFYFNYIIDNNNGIADNINVDDNIYPYSDGYLSKTAFELGLKRYEEAVESYKAEYEKYANGHKLYYKNFEDAIEHAAPTHKFYVLKDETDTLTDPAGFDLQAESTAFDWLQFPTGGSLDPTSPPVYDGVEPDNYAAGSYGSDNNNSVDEGAMRFVYKDLRKVKFVKIGNSANAVEKELYVPVKFDVLLFLRTGLPVSHATSFISTYNYMRIYININNEVRTGVEIYVKDITNGYFGPHCPAIGNIKVIEDTANKNLQFSLLHEIVTCREDPNSSGNYIFGNNREFFFLDLLRNSNWGKIANTVLKCATFDSGMAYKSVGGSDIGNLTLTIQPNFAGGYVFSRFVRPTGSPQGVSSIYEIPKAFDALAMSENLQPSLTKIALNGTTWKMVGNAIANDTVISKTNVDNFVYKDGELFGRTPYSELPLDSEDKDGFDNPFRVGGDFKLHNGRIFFADDSQSSFYKSAGSSNKISINAYINNRKYRISTTYGELFGSSNVNYKYISNAKILAANVCFDETLDILWETTILDSTSGDKWRTVQFETNMNGVNSVIRRVAIEDVDGSTNVMWETVC